MNEIIKKSLEELSKESPRLDYVRGMLETILVMSPTTYPTTTTGTIGTPFTGGAVYTTTKTNEEIYADKYNSGPIGELN